MSLMHERARVAALSRSRAVTDPELLDARRSLKTERLAKYIETTIAEFPPLTNEACDRLANLLRAGDAR